MWFKWIRRLFVPICKRASSSLLSNKRFSSNTPLRGRITEWVCRSWSNSIVQTRKTVTVSGNSTVINYLRFQISCRLRNSGHLGLPLKSGLLQLSGARCFAVEGKIYLRLPICQIWVFFSGQSSEVKLTAT